MSHVTSRPLRPLVGTRQALAVVLLAFGIPMWLANAKYTLDGWLWALNVFLAWFLREFPQASQQSITIAIREPVIYVLVALIAGIVYSVVEVRFFPHWRSLLHVATLGWLLSFISDLGTTFAGVIAPLPSDAWPISLWLANNFIAAGSWTIIICIFPEVMLIGALKSLQR